MSFESVQAALQALSILPQQYSTASPAHRSVKTEQKPLRLHTLVTVYLALYFAVVDTSVVSRAAGSAYVEIGDTKVMASV